MTRQQVASLARGVFGSHGFQSELAKLGKVHRSTAHRWLKGEIPIPPVLITELRKAAAHKAAELQQAIAA